jgi:hypothetical protein
MITVTQNVGRLTEIRMTAPVSVEDVATMQRDMTGIIGRAQSRVVICADLSSASLFTDDLADRMAKFFRTANTKLERTAIVVCGAATLFLQIERLLREGPAPQPGARPDSSRDVSSGRPSRNGEAPSTKRGSDPHMAKRIGTDPMLHKRTSERKAFPANADAMTWLAEVLTSEERARLRMFLEGPRLAR